MCGILATINAGLTEEEVARAVDTLAHRGPDGRGVYLDDRWGVALAHRRLAIIDRRGSAQPLLSADRQLALICNGVIYDFEEHRAELRRRGHTFQTRGDSEVLLALYRQHGMSFLERVDGEFAFVLLDRRRGLVYAARDRFGVKPLYLAETSRGTALASEAKAIFATGVVLPALDPAALRDNIVGLFTDSVFRRIRSVPAGSYVTFDLRMGRTSRRSFWELPPRGPDEAAPDLRATATELAEEIDGAIERRLTADREVGLYFSGGIDSTILSRLALARRPGLKVYHIGFRRGAPRRGPDGARELIRRLGGDYAEVIAGDEDLLRALEEYLWFAELPSHNCHGAAKYLLSQRAAREVRVALTGEGADEMFLGYPYFDQGPLTAVKDLVARAANLGDRPSPHPMTNLRCSAPFQELTARLFDRRHRAALAASPGALTVRGYTRESGPRPELWRLQQLSIAGRLTQYIIPVLGDRCEMAHGIEGRPLYLDRRLVEHACALPPSVLIRHGEGKRVLRELLREWGLGGSGGAKRSFMSPVLAVRPGESAAMDALIRRHLDRRAVERAGVFSARSITGLRRLREGGRLHPAIARKIDGILLFVATVHILHERFVAPRPDTGSTP